ncbi:MAG: ABC transporter permease subunit [Planctomycetaceae bacterium]|jgi:ABC-type transport system involved in multi-copper enzyme maturation permease subunit|nr:ABC transporter permease subunit [Planctomycetaceae bacterium]
MLIGPVFTREIAAAPRKDMTYFLRSIYAGVLLLLTATAWLVISGTQLIADTGDFARFGAMLFQFLAPVQLVLSLFFASVLAASAVGQEKERKTMLLLLLTRMSNSELVLGKLLASLLNILVMLAVSLPVFMTIAVLGGVSYYQIVRVLLVTLFSMLACGSLGSCIALWREKTFQAIATTILVIVLWLAVWESLAFNGGIYSALATAFSPWSAVLAASRPEDTVIENGEWKIGNYINSINAFLVVCSFLVVAINGFAVVMVRIWNPSRELTTDNGKLTTEESEKLSRNSKKRNRQLPTLNYQFVWSNPVIWREIMTRAYGKRVWLIQFGFLAFFAMCAYALYNTLNNNLAVSVAEMSAPLVPLFLLSLMLVNTQAITSQTSEKDGGTFDLLLVSDITPKEYVFGKLGGVFYNTKWIVLLPVLLCGYLFWEQAINGTTLFFLLIGLTVMYVFSAMTGIYIGMQYDNTRAATATSLGILFFLFVGIAACMWIMVAFSGSFETQLVPFSAFMVGGGVGLYITLGARNPSSAIAAASFSLPLAVFYIITSMLLGKYLLVFAVLAGAFGFTTAAMLIPAVAEFDVATGRVNGD